MIEFLKTRDRVLLEMFTGNCIFGLAAEIIGAFFVHDFLRYSLSIWFGILCAILGTLHMARTLDKALPLGEAASKIITMGYIVRYIGVALVLVGTAVTGILDTVFVFIGYMSMKVAAYLQPFTHKLYNKLFHETDPEPTPMPEEDAES